MVDDVVSLLKEDYCDDPETCTLDDIKAMGMTIITSKEEYNAIDWDEYEGNGYILEGPYASYIDAETGNEIDVPLQLISLDLSETIYLEIIRAGALNGGYSSTTEVDDTCTYGSKDQDYYCDGFLKEVILPKSGVLTTIGESAFSNNRIGNIIIPSSVEAIEEHAFGSNKVTTLIIEDSEENPSQLVSIHRGAFAYNNITGTIVIPASVNYIGREIFAYNPLLTNIVVKQTEEDTLANITIEQTPWNVVGFNNETQTSIYATITYDPNYSE